MEYEYDVFLAHNSQDKSEVSLFADKLRAIGFIPWFDDAVLVPGDNIPKEIAIGLEKSRAFIIFFSKAGAGQFQDMEIDVVISQMQTRKRRIIPALLPGADINIVSSFLNINSRVEFTTGIHDKIAFDKICNALNKDKSGRKPVLSETQPAPELAPDPLWKLKENIQSIIGENYGDIQLCKAGGNSLVFTADDKHLKRKVAIKVLRTYEDGFKTDDTSFEEEIIKIASLHHPHIVNVYFARLKSKPCFLVMEYIDGLNLNELCETTGAQTLRFTKKVIRHLAEAMRHCHAKGQLLSGLFPSKIIIDQEGNPYIIPFQFFHSVSESSRNNVPTEEDIYQSPESYDGKGFTKLSDQFVLGLIAFEMLTGKALFEGSSDRQINDLKRLYKQPEKIKEQLMLSGCPDAFISIVVRLLNYDPKLRYEYLSILIGDLDRVHFDISEKNVMVWESYHSICCSDSFFRLFYDKLFQEVPEIQAMFIPKIKSDMVHQYRILKHAMRYLLDFEAAAPEKPISRIAHKHGKSGLNIHPAHYDSFVKEFLNTLKEYDARSWNKDIENAWTTVLSAGIEFMKQHSG